jgi:hypothetical protein
MRPRPDETVAGVSARKARDLFRYFRDGIHVKGVADRLRLSKGLWCKRFEVEPSSRREVALDHAARTAFQILGAVLPLAPSLPSLN